MSEEKANQSPLEEALDNRRWKLCEELDIIEDNAWELCDSIRGIRLQLTSLESIREKIAKTAAEA
ncbi:hypothetical protein [Parerythrobacter aestuarii]|uniref:hypothetical protein n=1 Tax=Parerythrobacter aestuarii TaxID=3020909 RepID=UPI0024DE16B5|nr:hypothetical protein [Parerythrobacter aestuarii]